MKAKFQVVKPEDVKFKMTIEMSLRDWKKLSKQLYDAPTWLNYPSCRMIECIGDMTRKANTVIAEDPESDRKED